MPKADLVGEHIVITDIAYRDRDACHELPGYSYKNNVTRCKATWPAMVILKSLFPNRLSVGEELTAWLWTEYNDRVKLAGDSHDWAMDPGNECSDEFFERLQRCGLA